MNDVDCVTVLSNQKHTNKAQFILCEIYCQWSENGTHIQKRLESESDTQRRQ